jgi:hypothetical protein
MSFSGSVKTLRANAESLFYGTAMGAVTLAAGFISYTHISALVTAEHQSWKTAHLMFLPVDGQIVIGTGYYMRNSGRRRRFLGLLGFLPGFGESAVANWMSGSPHGLFAALVATVPAEAFAVSSYLFERWLHEWRQGRPSRTQTSPLAAAPAAAAAAAASRFPVLVSSVPQAAEPAAPGPEPEAAANFLHVHERPEGTPWGLAGRVPVTAAPEPERSGEVSAPARTSFAGTGWPGPFPMTVVPQVRGPVEKVARPAVRPATRKTLLDEDDPQVIRDAHAMTLRAFSLKYGSSKHAPDRIRKNHPKGVSSSAA